MNFDNDIFRGSLHFWYGYFEMKGRENTLSENWEEDIIDDFNKNFKINPNDFVQPYIEKDMYNDIACFIFWIVIIGRVFEHSGYGYHNIASLMNDKHWYYYNVKGISKRAGEYINYLQ